MQKLYSYQSLIANISDELVDLATFLDIPAGIDLEDDHIYLLQIK